MRLKQTKDRILMILLALYIQVNFYLSNKINNSYITIVTFK
jgi:hypothetical protein